MLLLSIIIFKSIQQISFLIVLSDLLLVMLTLELSVKLKSAFVVARKKTSVLNMKARRTVIDSL